jgi:hypothetical protein
VIARTTSRIVPRDNCSMAVIAAPQQKRGVPRCRLHRYPPGRQIKVASGSGLNSRRGWSRHVGAGRPLPYHTPARSTPHRLSPAGYKYETPKSLCRDAKSNPVATPRSARSAMRLSISRRPFVEIAAQRQIGPRLLFFEYRNNVWQRSIVASTA